MNDSSAYHLRMRSAIFINELSTPTFNGCCHGLGSRKGSPATLQASVSISTGDIIDGQLPRTAACLVKEWAVERKSELESAWQAAQAHRQPQHIAPLE